MSPAAFPSVRGCQFNPLYTVNFSSLNIYSADTNESLFPDSDPVTWAPTNFESTTLPAVPPDLGGHQGRVIAQGFEVHNTTSDLYKQGTVTLGRVSQNNKHTIRSAEGYTGEGWSSELPSTHSEFSAPPSSLAEAMTYPNSVQWEARKGCYCVVPLSTVNNEVTPVSSHIPTFHKDIHRGFGDVGFGGMVGVISETNFRYGSFCQQAHTDTVFAYFTGLSQETTLTVHFRSFVEIFPMYNDTLLAMATPSASYDVKALALYGSTISTMPIACPVDQNAKGDWWRKVVKTVASCLPMIGIAFPEVAPFVAPVSAGLNFASNIGRRKVSSFGSPQNQQAAPSPPRLIRRTLALPNSRTLRNRRRRMAKRANK
jgi:hypothetical protein